MHAVPFLIVIMLSLLLLLLLLLQRTPVTIGVMVRLNATGKQQHMAHVAPLCKARATAAKIHIEIRHTIYTMLSTLRQPRCIICAQ